MAVASQILSCAHAQRVGAKRFCLDCLQSAFARTMLDDGFDAVGAQGAVYGSILIDAAKERFDIGAAPNEPFSDQIAAAFRCEC